MRGKLKYNSKAVEALLEQLDLEWFQVQIDYDNRLFIHVVNYDDEVCKLYLDNVPRLLQ